MLTRTARILVLPSLALLVALALAAPAGALLVTVGSADWPICNPLGLSGEDIPLDELGNPPAFPPDEAISSSVGGTAPSACPSNDGPLPNVVVSITNLTTKSFPNVWYVGDSAAALETTLSNTDGQINASFPSAFRIDSVGLNQPLIFESVAYNDAFDPGETWECIIDDYSNMWGLPASALATWGVGWRSMADTIFSGSILVPELGTIMLAALGLAGLALLARKPLKA
jgi:hypothetical protein